MQRTLLTLALIATAGVSHAQTMSAGEPTDPYGRPLVGRNDWVRQPGDQAGPRGAAMQPTMQYNGATTTRTVTTYSGNVATAPASQPPMPTTEKTTNNNRLEQGHAVGQEPVSTDATGRRQTTMKDEYGFRYDDQGNRIDARGNIISPHIPQR
ncbi:hypothetical protein SAMN02990966_02368 [Rhodospirillales bacterium URHD0017]|nr:hypothetical protein SAMN02990966_02368 [Rhodospirillales bacterium URHD0017]